jgi:2'-5' RNA ligase
VTDAWYWGATIRVDAAAPLLARLQRDLAAPGLHVQEPATAHVTLLYAPLRGAGGAHAVADRVRDAARETAPFTITLEGLFEFTTPTRVVAWLGASRGRAELQELRARVCGCDTDVLPHVWQPHCTLLYAEEPGTYPALRPRVIEACADVRLDVTVDALWIAGFPESGHAAHDLQYADRVPLGT